MRLTAIFGLVLLGAGLAAGGSSAQLLEDTAGGRLSVDAGNLVGDTLSGLGLGGTSAGVGAGGNDLSVTVGNGASGGGVSLALNSGASGGSGSSSGGGAGSPGGAPGRSSGSGGSSGGGTPGVDRLLELDRLIRSRDWQRMAALDCATHVEVVRLSSWLGRQDYARLPDTMARNAMEIGTMQNALAADPDLKCLLRQARLGADRVVATDLTGQGVTLLVI